MRPRIFLMLILTGTCSTLLGQSTAQFSDEPVDGVEGVLGVFDDHEVVAIGRVPGLQEFGDFLNALVRHPDFSKQVRHVVVEWGNAHFQPTLDRYLAGEDVSDDELQQIWRVTIARGPAPTPISDQDFFRVVREVNQKLPADERIQVVLGDPPLNPKDPPKRRPTGFDRDAFFAEQVLKIANRGQRVLAVTGGFHLLENGFPMPPPGAAGGPVRLRFDEKGNARPAPQGRPDEPLERPQLPPNVRQILAKEFGGSVFVVQPHTGLDGKANDDLESHLRQWPVPGLATLAASEISSVLERDDARDLMHPELDRLDRTWGDAYLYLGPVGELTMSPFVRGEPGQPFLDSVRDSRRFMGLGGD